MCAPPAARCGAGADIHWVCRLQRRHVDAALPRFFFQSFCLATRSHGFGPRPGRAPRTSAICPPAIAGPILGPCERSTAILSDRERQLLGRGRGVTSYAPPGQPIETTGSAAPRSVAANHGSGHGGTTIIVGTSDTLDTLSRHYKVSPAAILQANGYKGPRALSPGQQLIIPRPTTAAAAPASKTVAATTATPSVHVVNRGDTLLSIARRNHVSIAELAKANNLDRSAKLKLGMKLTVPGAKTAAVTPAAQPRAGAQPATASASPATKLAAVTPKPQEKARLAQATTTPAELSTETPVKATEATGALPTFRWPVRGKVITSYGAKTNGKANDGINLSVPEGTPVRAAEDGVVDYSGNERQELRQPGSGSALERLRHRLCPRQ